MRTLLIDGNNLLYRTFWAANYKAKNQDPGNIAATYIFLRTLKSYADKFSPCDKIYCVWDKRLAYPESNFRAEICDTEYKGGRGDEKFKNVFDSLEKILPLIEDLGIYNFYPHRMEADDAISWLSEIVEGEKIIITTDKDMLQLINEDISVYNTNTKSIINLQNFEEVTDINNPKNYLMFRCFTGDKSDNIPGVSGIGPKTLLKHVSNLHNEKIYELDTLWETCNNKIDESKTYKKILDNQNIISDNWKLMNLKLLDIPAQTKSNIRKIMESQVSELNKAEFRRLFMEDKMWSVMKNMPDWLNNTWLSLSAFAQKTK